jgi:hypothetical protein
MIKVTPLLVPGRVVVVRIPAQLRPVPTAHAGVVKHMIKVPPLPVPGRVVVVRVPAQLRPVPTAHARNCQTYD